MSLLTLFRTKKAAALALLASDTFPRTVSPGWGSADQGGAWTMYASNGVVNTNATSVNGTQGQIALSSTIANKTGVLATGALTTDQVVDIAVDALSTAGMNHAILSRMIDINNNYRFNIAADAVGAISLRIFQVIAGTATGAEGKAAQAFSRFAWDPTKVLRVRAYTEGVNGTKLKMKLWRTDMPEPANWDFEATNTNATLDVPSGVGVRAVVGASSNNVNVSFDNLNVYGGLSGSGRQASAAVSDAAAAISSPANWPDGSLILTNGTIDAALVLTRNVTLQSLVPGGTTIRGGAPDVSKTWTLDTNNVWYTTVAYSVYALSVNGRPLYHFGYGDGGTLANLKAATWPSGTGATGNAPPEGFFYDSGASRLYIRVTEDGVTYVDPNTIKATIAWNRSGVNEGSNGHGITVADGVQAIISGIILDLWPNSGVSVGDNGAYADIYDTFFHNCRTAVKGTISAAGVSRNYRLTRSEASGRGASGLYNGPYEMRRLLGNEAFKGLYDSNLNFRLTNTKSQSGKLDRVYFHDMFDGWQAIGYDSTPHTGLLEATDVLAQNIVDNPLEVEPTGEYTNLRVQRWMLIDCVTNLATAPWMPGSDAQGYGSGVIENVGVYQSPAAGVTDGQVSLLKNTAHGSIVPSTSTQQKLSIRHITAVLGIPADGQTSQLYVVGDSEQFDYHLMELWGSIIRINTSRAYARGARNGTGHTGYLLGSDNSISGPNVNPAHYQQGTAYSNSATHGDARPPGGVNTADPQLVNIFFLSASSPGRGAARDGSDLGAIPYGQTTFLQPLGVTWIGILYRPALPAGVAAATVGLA